MEQEKRQDFEIIHGEETNLIDLIELYLKENETTDVSLFRRSGLAHSVFTSLKKGMIPEPETVRRLADAMSLSRGRLFFLSGYLQETDLRLTYGLSPSDESFLRRYRVLTDDVKDIVRSQIKVAVIFAFFNKSSYNA